MWSFVRSISVTLLAASTVTAQLSFVASVQQGGQEVDASNLTFVPIPPLRHRKHASESDHGYSKAERDLLSYSSNWCGASQHASKADGVSNVFGYFTVPDLKLRSGTAAPQYAAAWVGIDGAECNTTLLQAGVTTVVRDPHASKPTLDSETFKCG